jgi:hypothetical protein
MKLGEKWIKHRDDGKWEFTWRSGPIFVVLAAVVGLLIGLAIDEALRAAN